MSKFILFTNGILAARYDSAINLTIPADAVPVTDELFFQTINEQDGTWSLVDGEIVKQPFPDPTSEELQSQLNAESRAYLDGTDWYVTRFAETGIAIPDDIKIKRQEARNAIV